MPEQTRLQELLETVRRQELLGELVNPLKYRALDINNALDTWQLESFGEKRRSGLFDEQKNEAA